MDSLNTVGCEVYGANHLLMQSGVGLLNQGGE